MRWLVAMGALSCAEPPTPCALGDSLADLAGPDALSCGTFDAASDPSIGWACAIDGWQSGSPFAFSWAEGTVDSAVVHGIASDGARLFFLYQGMDRGVLRDVDGRECTAPVIVDPTTATTASGAPSGAILDCEQYVPAGRVWLFCTTEPDEPDQVPFPG